MSWIDWATLIGLVLALAQLLQVGRLASATHRAVTDMARRTGNYSVLLLVPRLVAIEHDCENAASKGDVERTIDALRQWRDGASELRGYLGSDPSIPEAILTAVQTSLSSATRAKAQVVNEPGNDILDATRVARGNMTKVCEEVSTLAARMRVYVEPRPAPKTIPELLSALRQRVFGNKNEVQSK